MDNAEKRFDAGFLIILALFIFQTCYVSPLYEFAINDDWAYSLSVKNLHEKGTLSFIGAANSFFHTIWGWFFVLPLGFSFSALRISTLSLHLMGSMALYRLLREMKLPMVWCLFSVLLVISNPWVFNLSYSFMTDIPFVSLLVIGTLFYYEGIFRNKNIFLWMGSIVSSLCFLVREIGILLPISVCIYLLLCERRSFRKRTLSIVGIPLIVFVTFEYWYIFVHGVTESHKYHRDTMLNNLMNVRVAVQFFERSLIILYYLGLTLLSLSPLLLFSLKKTIFGLEVKKKVLLGTLISVIILLGVRRFLKGDYFPIDGFFLSGSLLGVLEGVKPPVIALSGAKILFLVSIVSGCILFSWFYSNMGHGWTNRKDMVFFMVLGLIQFCYLLIAPFFFVRYYIPFVPFVVLAASLSLKGTTVIRSPLIFSLLIIPALFSLTTTKDSLSWNQSKWSAAETLIRKGIAPTKIEAGIEWDCWKFYEYSKKHQNEKVKRYYPVPWWLIDLAAVIDPVYKLSFSEMEGYELNARRGYKSPLFRTPQEIFVLIKTPPRTVEGFEEPQRDFTTGWNHNLQMNVLQLNRNPNFISEGASSLKCNLKANPMDTYHYGGVRVKAPMNTVGFIFDLWLINPKDVERIFVYCYDGNGNFTAAWYRELTTDPIRENKKNMFYFLFPLSQDGFQFNGGNGGKTDYVDIFVESDKKKNVVFYIDNFRR